MNNFKSKSLKDSLKLILKYSTRILLPVIIILSLFLSPIFGTKKEGIFLSIYMFVLKYQNKFLLLLFISVSLYAFLHIVKLLLKEEQAESDVEIMKETQHIIQRKLEVQDRKFMERLEKNENSYIHNKEELEKANMNTENEFMRWEKSIYPNTQYSYLYRYTYLPQLYHLFAHTSKNKNKLIEQNINQLHKSIEEYIIHYKNTL